MSLSTEKRAFELRWTPGEAEDEEVSASVREKKKNHKTSLFLVVSSPPVHENVITEWEKGESLAAHLRESYTRSMKPPPHPGVNQTSSQVQDNERETAATWVGVSVVKYM